MRAREFITEISRDRLERYLGQANRQIDSRQTRMAQARERLNRSYEIYHADRPAGGTQIVDRFEANTPQEAQRYYEKFITRYESDRDFDLQLRRSTGIMEDAFRGIDISMEREDDEIMVRASAGGKQLGSVLFVEYDGVLTPQDLEVDERFRGQGIAQAMYDYVKSQGYRIRRSGQQTDAGAGFWGKHRPDTNVWENFADGNSMSTKDMIAYLRQHHDTNLHQDYLDHINTFGKFVLKNIPVSTIKTELSGLDQSKVEKYKQMDFSKAPPIVMGDGYILDGYHRATVAKALGIPTIKGYVGIKGQQDMTEGYRRKLNFDEIYGKYLKVTDNNGDPRKPGFSIVTPLNGDSWNWRERPEFIPVVKKKLNQPGWLGDHKYQQIIDSMSGKQFDPTKHIAKENFADGKVKGKSRPGRVKRSGASCNGSVTDLRRKAKNASGEKAKMYHWCANMKSGRKKAK